MSILYNFTFRFFTFKTSSYDFIKDNLNILRFLFGIRVLYG
jgi:hypothetical protein